MTDRPSWGLGEGDTIGAGRTIVRALGGGKRTEVFLATDDALRTPVVVKVLRPEQSDVARRALAKEAELVETLKHPVFPRLLEAAIDADPPHIVLENVEGPRLSTLARKHGALDLEQLVSLALQLAGGMHYLHHRGYVHLDVKPSNTIMGATPRIIDLGVARTLERAAEVRGTVGTHRFQSPEQHHPETFGGLTPKADVWGVGITVLFAARGTSPFGPLRDEDDERRKLTEQDVEWLSFPPSMSPALVEIVRDTLRWDPTERPTAAEVHERLEPLVAAAPRRPVLGRRRPGRRRR